MNIGIPKETKTGEARVGLLPEYVKKLVKAGHQVSVEKNLGKKAKISDGEYKKAGAKVVDSVYDLEMIVRVKEPPLDSIQENQLIMGYLHIEKKQNPKLLRKLKRKKTTAIAYEEIRDEDGFRKINLGSFAGEEGMKLALEIYGKENPRVFIMGYGNVARGAYDICRKEGYPCYFLGPYELERIEKYAKKADILVNALIWKPGMPKVITKEMLPTFKKDAIICDISCDESGAVETCVPTTIDKPMYAIEGVRHLCVDNLPARNPIESSRALNEKAFSYILEVANGKLLETGVMVLQGKKNFKVKKGHISYKHNGFEVEMV